MWSFRHEAADMNDAASQWRRRSRSRASLPSQAVHCRRPDPRRGEERRGEGRCARHHRPEPVGRAAGSAAHLDGREPDPFAQCHHTQRRRRHRQDAPQPAARRIGSTALVLARHPDPTRSRARRLLRGRGGGAAPPPRRYRRIDGLPSFRPRRLPPRLARRQGQRARSLRPRNHKGKPTALFNEIGNTAKHYGCNIVEIDALHDVFEGDEINRSEARQFIGYLRSIAIAIDGAVVLNAHPSAIRDAERLGNEWLDRVEQRLSLPPLPDAARRAMKTARLTTPPAC